MKQFSKFLNESILDPEHPTLSVSIFDLGESPTLKPSVRTQVLARLAKLSKHTTVVDYTLIGSILTKRYADDSDVDINVLVSEKDENMDELRQVAISLSGHFVEGTKHPINLHVLNDESDFKNANDSADGVFDISTNTFIRVPIERPFYLDKYMSKFKDLVSKINDLKGDLKDDLIDYSELKKIPSTDVRKLQLEIEKELSKIESSAVGLIDLYDKVKSDRAKIFARPLSANDIKEYGAKNRLPENVIYKLLERHHYLNFLHQVKQIVGSDHKVSPDEADELTSLVKTTTYAS